MRMRMTDTQTRFTHVILKRVEEEEGERTERVKENGRKKESDYRIVPRSYL